MPSRITVNVYFRGFSVSMHSAMHTGLNQHCCDPFLVTIMAQVVVKLAARERYSGKSFVCTPTYSGRSHPRALCRV